jgi:uncharacterized 2Fe-2S/4Fe-4S cluster protein (DUF4445 family)
MEHHTITFKPDGSSLKIHAGATVFEAAAQAGLILNATCGGRGTCKKCKVHLGPDGREVLACQCKINGDLVVSVPKTSRFYEHKILRHGVERNIKLNPIVAKKLVKVTSSDPVSVMKCVVEQAGGCTLGDNAKTQAGLLNDASQACTLVTHDHTIICIEQGDTTSALYGVAVDIGTTTVVAKLVSLRDGQVKAVAATGNPQQAFGDDVISRISFGETEENLATMHQVIIDCINSLTAELCTHARITAEHIYELTIAGNTTMSHIFLKLPIKQLGQAPYHAYSVDAFDVAASKLGIAINPAGNVHTIENIAGFVGSDTTACAVAVSMDEEKKMTLVVDIGTNGEIILGTRDRMYSASCAAGPALEGARISQGSRAVDGAIERVVLNHEDIDLDVIANKTPRTICGSGLIDAVALLVELGIIDETGRFVDPATLKGKVPEKIIARIIEQEEGQYAFVLAHNKGMEEGPVILTQRDLRETQLAKAAIRAGIKLLQQKFGIGDEQIEQVLLAGAFGNYIRRESARTIGLLPNVPIERIQFVGNAASSGAQMVLTSTLCRALAGKLARQIEYVEIGHDPAFSMAFAESMMFDKS